MCKLFSLFKSNDESYEKIKAELYAIDNVDELHDQLLEDGKKARVASNCPDLLSKLAEYRFHDFHNDFLPPENNIARSSTSLLARLCRFNADIAFKVLTDPKLSSLLTNFDLLGIHEGSGKVKTMIIESDSKSKMDKRFLQFLDKPSGPSFAPA